MSRFCSSSSSVRPASSCRSANCRCRDWGARLAAPIMFRRNAPFSVRPSVRPSVRVRPSDPILPPALVSHTKSFSASFVIIYGPLLSLFARGPRSLHYLRGNNCFSFWFRSEVAESGNWRRCRRRRVATGPRPARRGGRHAVRGASECFVKWRACSAQCNESPNLMTRAAPPQWRKAV